MRIEWLAFNDKAEGFGSEDGIVGNGGRHWVFELDPFGAAKMGMLNQSAHDGCLRPDPRRLFLKDGGRAMMTALM